MKVNIQRVVKCLTCAITVFMVVLSAMTTPVYAVWVDVDPADYVTSITVVDGVKTVNYEFAGFEPYVNFWANLDGSTQVDTYRWMVQDYAKQMALTYYPLGREAQENWPIDSGRIVTADIIPGCPIDISFQIGLVFYYDQYDGGVYENTYYPSYTAGFYTYDKDGNYLDTVSLTVAYDAIQHDGNSAQGYTFNITGTVPLDAYAVLPWFKLDLWFGENVHHHYLYVTLTPGTLKMSTAVDSIVEQSHQMTVIQNKLDDILTGTSEQNENANNSAGTVEDQKDQIEDLVDQMTPSRPNTDHIDTDINAIAGADATALFADGMSGILNHPLILSMLSIVAVVSFIGYVLFGKVG